MYSLLNITFDPLALAEASSSFDVRKRFDLGSSLFFSQFSRTRVTNSFYSYEGRW